MTAQKKTVLQKRERKGLIFIQEMTLCNVQDAFNGIAAADNHQVSTL